MDQGITVDVKELIALKKLACLGTTFKKQMHLAPLAGGYNVSARGRGMDFAEVRHYQAGDEIRHMEWRVTARTGKPHIKIYHEERERPVILLTDFSASMYFGTRKAFKSVVAARLSALLAWAAIKQEDRVGALLCGEPHQEFIPRSKDKNILSLLASISHFTQEAARLKAVNTGFNEALQRVEHVVNRGSLIIILSDFYQLDANTLASLHRLRKQVDILPYYIYDPIEVSPLPAGQYGISNGQQDAFLNMHNPLIFKQYHAWCEKKQQDLARCFKSLSLPYYAVSALDNLPQIVYRTFPRRKDA